MWRREVHRQLKLCGHGARDFTQLAIARHATGDDQCPRVMFFSDPFHRSYQRLDHDVLKTCRQIFYSLRRFAAILEWRQSALANMFRDGSLQATEAEVG